MANETAHLQSNIEMQLTRLLNQLNDLESLRSDLDDDEYEETKRETLSQMAEFQQSLAKMMKGDLSLLDRYASVQLAMQAAVSQAFQTPEVISLFARKQPQQLRQKLANLDRDAKLHKIDASAAAQQQAEILIALKKLGEHLSSEELQFLKVHSSGKLAEFETVDTTLIDKSHLSSSG